MPAVPKLSQVIGQRALGTLLARLVERRRLPHAVALEGQPGSGRRTMATALAKAVLCAQRVGGDACNACESCALVDAGAHPDCASLPHDSESDDLPADAVRALADSAYESPLLGGARVFILPGVERLNPAAGNAVLKALEEPPPAAYFIMTTASANAMLPTIRSRAALYRLRPLTAAEVEAVLVRGGVEAQLARVRAAQSGGGHRGLWDERVAVAPVEALLRLSHGELSARLVEEVVGALPQRLAEAAPGAPAATLAGEQRRICRGWLNALLHALRTELIEHGDAVTVGRIERVLSLRADLQRNIAPRLVIEGLALAGLR